jgi:hypothetical protein
MSLYVRLDKRTPATQLSMPTQTDRVVRGYPLAAQFWVWNASPWTEHASTHVSSLADVGLPGSGMLSLHLLSGRSQLCAVINGMRDRFQLHQ